MPLPRSIKLRASAIILLLLNLHSFAQWSILPFPSTEDLLDVQGVRSDDFVVLGEYHLWSTQDYGGSWNQELALPSDQPVMDRCHFKNLSIYDNDPLQHLLAIATDTTSAQDVVFRRTLSPPFRWEIVFVAPPLESVNDAAYGSGTYLLVGDDGGVWKSTSNADSASWSPIGSGLFQDLNEIAYASSADEFSIACDGWMLTYDDAGFHSYYTGSNGFGLYARPSSYVLTDGDQTIEFNPGYSDEWSPSAHFDGPLDIRDITAFGSFIYSSAMATSNGIYRHAVSGYGWERYVGTAGWELSALDHNSNFFAVGPNGFVAHSFSTGGWLEPWAGIKLDSFYCLGGSASATSISNSSYGHTWYVDGLPGTTYAYTALDLSTLGIHTVELIVTGPGSTGTDTMVRTYTVIDQLSAIDWSLADTFACFGGIPTALIAHSDTLTKYILVDVGTGETLDVGWGNGDTLELHGLLVDDSIQMTIIAYAAGLEDCATYANDSLTYAIEFPKSQPTNGLINAALGESVHLDHLSHDAAAFQWSFGADATPTSSTLAQPVVKWSSPGRKTIHLIVQSSHGCLDTSQTNGPYVYEDWGDGSPCQVRVLPMDTLRHYAVTDQRHSCRQAIDHSENRYIGSYCMDVYPQTSYGYRDTLIAPLGGSYLVKYDHAGTVKWMAGSVDGNSLDIYDFHSIFDVAVSPDDSSVYISGHARKHSVFYDAYGDSLNLHDFTYFSPGYIIKLNQHGRLQWGLGVSGTGVFRIDVDPLGNIYAIGNSSGSNAFFNKDGSTYTPAFRPSWGYDFIAKISPEGTYDWVTFSQNMDHQDILSANEGLYYAGKTRNSSWYPTDISTPFGGIWSGDHANHWMSLVFIDSTGVPQWRSGVRHSGPGADFYNSNIIDLKEDRNGNIYFNTKLRNTGALNGEALSSDGSIDTFKLGHDIGLFKFNRNGMFKWGVGNLNNYNYSYGFGLDESSKIRFSLESSISSILPTEFISTATSDTLRFPTIGTNHYVLKVDTNGHIEGLNLIYEKPVSPSPILRFKNLVSSPNGRIYLSAKANPGETAPISNIDVLGITVTIKPQANDVYIRLDSTLCSTPSIAVSVATTGQCLGDSIGLDYSITSSTLLEPGNLTRLWAAPVSSAGGTWILLDSIESTALSGSFSSVWPTDMPSNISYRLVVRTDLPIWEGSGDSLYHISAAPEPLYWQDTVCVGSDVVLQADEEDGYSYAWTPSSGLDDPTVSSPIWTVTGDQLFAVAINSVCGTVTDTVRIYANPLPIMGLPETLNVCGNDTVYVEADPSFEYTWYGSPYYTDYNAYNTGIYTTWDSKAYVRATDTITGCHAYDTIAMYWHEKPLIALVDVPDTVCVDDPFVLNANTTGTYAFWAPGQLVADSLDWSTHGLISEPTRFIFLSTDTVTGCAAQRKVDVDVYATPDHSIVLADTVASVVPGYAYTWYYNGILIPDANTNSVALSDPGVYHATITYGDDCKLNTDSLVWVPSGWGQAHTFGWSLHPKPADAVLRICNTRRSPWQASAFKLGSGRRVWHQPRTLEPCATINTTQWPEGAYLIKLISNGQTFSKTVSIFHP